MKRINGWHLLFLIGISLLFTCCVTIPREHYSKQEVQFFNNKNEINTSLSFDINSYTMGFNLGGAWAFADHAFLNAGITNYNKDYLPRTEVVTPNTFNEGNTAFKGTRGRLGIGYFNNFGSAGNTYIEIQGEMGYGSNTLEFVELNNPISQSIWKYNPIDFGLSFAIGKNSGPIGVAFGLKAAQSLYGGEIPYTSNGGFFEPTQINDFVINYFYVNPNFILRAGSGPVKGQLQVGLLVNPLLIEFEEPTFKLSLGIHYVLGRKLMQPKVKREIEL